MNYFRFERAHLQRLVQPPANTHACRSRAAVQYALNYYQHLELGKYYDSQEKYPMAPVRTA